MIKKLNNSLGFVAIFLAVALLVLVGIDKIKGQVAAPKSTPSQFAGLGRMKSTGIDGAASSSSSAAVPLSVLTSGGTMQAGAIMAVADFDGDGVNDIIYSLSAQKVVPCPPSIPPPAGCPDPTQLMKVRFLVISGATQDVIFDRTIETSLRQ